MVAIRILAAVFLLFLLDVLFIVFLGVGHKSKDEKKSSTKEYRKLWAQSFTCLMADLRQDINRVSAFSRCLNGTFP